MAKKTNYDEMMLKALKFLLKRGEPATPYQVEKGSSIPHSTFSEHLKAMLKEGLLEVASKRKFKSGLVSKRYRLTAGGFTEAMISSLADGESLAPTEESFIRHYPHVWPWLSGQAHLILGQLKAPELFRGFLVTGMLHDSRLAEFVYSSEWDERMRGAKKEMLRGLLPRRTRVVGRVLSHPPQGRANTRGGGTRVVGGVLSPAPAEEVVYDLLLMLLNPGLANPGVELAMAGAFGPKEEKWGPLRDQAKKYLDAAPEVRAEIKKRLDERVARNRAELASLEEARATLEPTEAAGPGQGGRQTW
jgi:DNA-binding transcriptional ArsR family regulator